MEEIQTKKKYTKLTIIGMLVLVIVLVMFMLITQVKRLIYHIQILLM